MATSSNDTTATVSVPIIFIDDNPRPFLPEEHLYPPEYEGHIDSLVVSSHQIRNRIQQLAHHIHTDYQGTRPVLVCTLKGACPFYIHLTDCLQELRQGYDMEFVRASSYKGISSTGHVQIQSELNLQSIQGRHVLLVEDIVDTGTTLATLIPILKEQGQPATLEVCTLLDKRLDNNHGIIKKYTAKYIGFSIPDHFVIGYGLDYNELYRDLRDIFVISKRGIDFDATHTTQMK